MKVMQKVTVITGAASGIGRGLAERFAAEGMKVVLADVAEEPLAKLAADLKAKGAAVLTVRTDVSKATEVENLAEQTLDAFGAVHILCNNAGVVCSRPVWEHTLADWEWVLGVNLWGVIHGIRAFVPRMLAQGGTCHIVNTASILGLVGGSGEGIYKVSKHGVVVLSETLADELAQKGANIQVHVLCPGWVRTGILDSARNRPSTLQNPAETERPQEIIIGGSRNARVEMEAGLSPTEVAEHVYNAIQNGTFYIHTHPEHKAWIRERMARILE
ncbi:SDR family NAD(P)-dependent oxidoreductase [Candidatus Poribacteria bacterium]|nr:SDR family NAD(P)-dependent oxidoreductase [Candidatus Poribacteria bacterium]MYA58345.1 SDR family NAD(P)-dependent oxidoreductase [Candidatus Poribacteria bacterium]